MMGRKRLYSTARKLRTAVDEYFNGITRIRTLTEPLFTGRFDDRGYPMAEPREIISVLGEPVTVCEYLVPPSIRDLRRHLGISDETWRRYSADAELGPVCANARDRIEAYLEQQLIETPKAARGIIFNLQANFGWRSSHELSLDEPMRAAVAPTMTIDEKLTLLRDTAALLLGNALAQDIPTEEDDEAQ